MFGHHVQQHVRQHSQQHVQEHTCAHIKGGHSCHATPHHHGTPHHHAGPGHHHHGTPHHHTHHYATPHHYSHGTPHHHHNGSYHHPHNDGPHGGVYHWGTVGGNDPGWWWHAYWQSSFHHGFPHNNQKPNGHHTSYQPDGNASWRGRWWHGSFGGHDGHAHAHFGLPSHNHTHKPDHHHADGGSHAAHQPANHSGGTSVRHAPNWHHHPVAPTSHPNPDGHWVGGAGGVNDGVNTGKGAPAVTGGEGKRGGAGGGGAIIVVTDSVANTINYDTRAGLTDGSDNFSASNGAAYVLLNI